VLSPASRGAAHAQQRIDAVATIARGVVALALAVAALALGAAVASAETLTASCGTLQSEITTASASKGADTVVLTEMCKETVTLPAKAEFTLEGASGTTSGLDGEGLPGPLLETTEAGGAMTISNLTFEHATSHAFVGGALDLFDSSLTLNGDRFVDDTVEEAEAGGAGAYVVIIPPDGDACAAHEPPALTVTDSSFIGDTAKAGNGMIASHGGGLYAIIECGGRASYLDHDSFEDDSVTTTSSAEADGGGASLLDTAAGPGLLYQEGNVFDSDTVAGPAEGNRGGGGEWLEGINLTSVGDRFSRDSIPGTTGSKWSWGAGLGILNTSCDPTNPIESTLENAVVADNAIGAGTPADLGGAGIYVGLACGPAPENHSHLRLLDSTVTENSVATPGGVAGIDGHSSDQLTIANSIVATNDGGPEIGGFDGTGGLLSSTFSDVCDEAGTAPLTGEGDICANPLLADNGDPASFDVHETLSSPTIDAGSNALVPAGLTADFYGNTRILAARSYTPPCSPGAPYTGERLYPAVVDMGASEYGPIAVPTDQISCVYIPPAPFHPPTLFPPPSISQGVGGLVLLSFTSPLEVGTMRVLATTRTTRFVAIVTKGRRKRVRRTETIPYGSASFELPVRESFTLRIEPTRRALALLKRRKHLLVQLKITYDFAAGSSATQLKTITVVYRAPKRKHKH
jgi:hypothetical protein